VLERVAADEAARRPADGRVEDLDDLRDGVERDEADDRGERGRRRRPARRARSAATTTTTAPTAWSAPYPTELARPVHQRRTLPTVTARSPSVADGRRIRGSATARASATVKARSAAMQRRSAASVAGVSQR
jgi:hypothetical protein